MIKFIADGKDQSVLIGLGLSFDNLQRIRKDAIQFMAEDLGLGPGVFIIAHADDPQVPFYRAGVEQKLVCELILLTDNTCNSFQQRDLLVDFPLKCTRGGRPCKALMFAGETEGSLHEAFKRHGLITPATKVTGPDPIVERTSEFRVDPLNLFKLGAGGVGFVLITILLMFQRHHSDMDALVYAIMVATAAVFFTLLYLRLNERIEVDAAGIRRLRPAGAFTIPWKDLSNVQKQEDALGPYRLHFVTRMGRVHKLERIYGDWDGLLEEVVAQGRRP